MAKKISHQDLHTILLNYTKNTSVKLITSDVSVLSSDVEGFMGDYFILKVEFETTDGRRKNEEFFVKGIPTHTEFQTRIARQRNVYGKEIFFFDKLLSEYNSFGLDISFAPRCYYCKDDQMLIMENLIPKGFQLSKKNIIYDFDQCLTGIKALALYHGSSILYEEKMSQKLKKQFRLDREYSEIFKENYYCLDLEDEFGKQVLEKSINSIKFIVDNLKNEKIYKTEFLESLAPNNILSCFITPTNYRKATGHGDLWYNNIFFKYDHSKAVQCKIIDFQVLRYMYPVYDVILFLYLNTNKEFRSKHLQSLFDYYYVQISEYFADRGHNISNIYSLNEYKESLKFVEFCALFNVISIGTLIFMPPDILNDFYAAMDDATFDKHYIIFCKQIQIPSEFRTRLIEAVDDLYECFLSKSS